MISSIHPRIGPSAFQAQKTKNPNTRTVQASSPQFGMNQPDVKNPESAAGSAAHSVDVLFNAPAIHQKLTENIGHYKKKLSESPDSMKPLASHFQQADHPALFQPKLNKPEFYTRTPDLNQIPLFFADFDTEIAKAEDIKKLPPWKKAMASTRLIAKRFTDVETGKHFLSDISEQKAVNTVKNLEWPVRAIRAHAATATLDQYPGKYIRDLYQKVFSSIDFPRFKKPVPVYMVQPSYAQYSHDYAINFLALAAQGMVTDTLNELAKQNGDAHLIRFSDDKPTPTVTRTKRTHSGPIGRLVQQAYFDTSEIQPDDHVVIVDDHCQAGGAILSLAAAIKQAGGKVLAAITPTTHPFSRTLQMSPEVHNQLKNTLAAWDPDGHVENKLKQFGMPLNTLTSHEAMIIMAYATAPDDEKAVRQFQTLEAKLYGNAHILEGASDSLAPILRQKPETAHAVVQLMDADNLKNRNVIEPVPFKNVHVLAYDSLRDAQGMNYQLLQHALTAAASQYEKKHPFLRQLADAVTSSRQTPDRNKAGMPLISLTPENFRQRATKQSSIDETVLLANLLNNLETVDPELKQQFDKLPLVAPKPGQSSQTAIRNILRHEFRRQYQRMLTQNPSQQTPSSPPLSNAEPMMFAPHAQPLLDKLRRPENFVLLRSDSPQGDVEKEINRQGCAHYFDAISGTSDSSASKNNQSSEFHSESVSKQNPDFSQADMHQLLSKRPYLEKLTWHF